jgi:5-methylcytosine-specific restriction protein A
MMRGQVGRGRPRLSARGNQRQSHTPHAPSEDPVRHGQAIACEVCGFDVSIAHGERGSDYIECHHRTPLHTTGPTVTRLKDLALICSNCHRMLQTPHG